MNGDEPIDYEGDPDRLRRRIEWEKDRAAHPRRRKNQTDSGFESDFARIQFPDAQGLRHAALVVAGAMLDSELSRYDAVRETRLILDILGIPQIMADGGDGRPVKIQHGPVRFGNHYYGEAFSTEIEDAKRSRNEEPPDAPLP